MAQCVAHRANSDQRCKRTAIKGGTVCIMHGGSVKRIRANAEVRLEVDKWVLGDIKDDPREVLLRLITQSRRRADTLARALAEKVEEVGGLEEALVGQSIVLDEQGNEHVVGEYIRGLAQMESAERDRLATFTSKAIAAGLAERQIRVAESQGALLAQAMLAVMRDPALQFTRAQMEAMPSALEKHLLALQAATLGS